VDWGDDLIPYFTLVVRVITDGDMHQNHMGFIEYATAYDTGDINMRSKAKQSMMSGKIY